MYKNKYTLKNKWLESNITFFVLLFWEKKKKRMWKNSKKGARADLQAPTRRATCPLSELSGWCHFRNNCKRNSSIKKARGRINWEEDKTIEDRDYENEEEMGSCFVDSMRDVESFGERWAFCCRLLWRLHHRLRPTKPYVYLAQNIPFFFFFLINYL